MSLLDDDALPFNITEISQAVPKCSPPGFVKVGRIRRQEAYPPGLPCLLRLSGKWRRHYSKRESAEESASVHHSITWSARSSSDCGIVRPSALAVLRLITSSNFVGCSTGRAAGLAPLRILSTYVAVRRKMSRRSGP